MNLFSDKIKKFALEEFLKLMIIETLILIFSIILFTKVLSLWVFIVTLFALFLITIFVLEGLVFDIKFFIHSGDIKDGIMYLYGNGSFRKGLGIKSFNESDFIQFNDVVIPVSIKSEKNFIKIDLEKTYYLDSISQSYPLIKILFGNYSSFKKTNIYKNYYEISKPKEMNNFYIKDMKIEGSKGIILFMVDPLNLFNQEALKELIPEEYSRMEILYEGYFEKISEKEKLDLKYLTTITNLCEDKFKLVELRKESLPYLAIYNKIKVVKLYFSDYALDEFLLEYFNTKDNEFKVIKIVETEKNLFRYHLQNEDNLRIIHTTSFNLMIKEGSLVYYRNVPRYRFTYLGREGAVLEHSFYNMLGSKMEENLEYL